MAGGKVPISVATIKLPYTDAQLKSIFGKAVDTVIPYTAGSS